MLSDCMMVHVVINQGGLLILKGFRGSNLFHKFIYIHGT